jgi:uncharacterized membrane protein
LAEPADEGENLRGGPNIPRPRIQGLSDLIFGLALSIGALSLISNKPANVLDLVHTLEAFGFSFAILGMIWVEYTRIMSVLRVETGELQRINLGMLFFVSVEPYLFNLIITPGQLGADIASSAYALDIGSIFLVLAYFAYELTRKEKRLIPEELMRTYGRVRNGRIATALLFYASVLPVFWGVSIFGTDLRYILWLAAFAIRGATTEAERRKSRPREVQTKLQDGT